MSTKHFDKVIEQLGILIVDGNQYSRKLTRTMLMNVGAKTIMESPDGVTALDLIRNSNPDVAIIEWDLPVLSGPELVRIRSEEHTSELQSHLKIVCRLLLEKKKSAACASPFVAQLVTICVFPILLSRA